MTGSFSEAPENQKPEAGPRLLPRDLQPIVKSKELGDANLTHRVFHDFSGLMILKLQQYQGRFPVAWFDKSWVRNELDLEIARCIMEGDYISAANYAMMAHHLQHEGADGSAPAKMAGGK